MAGGQSWSRGRGLMRWCIRIMQAGLHEVYNERIYSGGDHFESYKRGSTVRQWQLGWEEPNTWPGPQVPSVTGESSRDRGGAEHGVGKALNFLQGIVRCSFLWVIWVSLSKKKEMGFMPVRMVCAKDEVIGLQMVVGIECMRLPRKCHTQWEGKLPKDRTPRNTHIP